MPEPIYRSIAEDLRRQIEAGDLRPGQQLPTEIELREHYNASRNTIRDAIKLLVTRGLIETRPGQGTFVVETIIPFVTILTGDPETENVGEGDTYIKEVTARRRRPTFTLPEVGIHQAGSPVPATGELQLPEGTPVVSRHQQRYIDDIPWSLQTSFYPLEFISKGATQLLMAQDIPEGAVNYLAAAIGVRQVSYRDWITARLPDDNEQRFFGIGHDLTVFEIFRTAFDQNQTPMRLTVTVFPTDRNQFIVNVGSDLPDPRYDEESGQTS